MTGPRVALRLTGGESLLQPPRTVRRRRPPFLDGIDAVRILQHAKSRCRGLTLFEVILLLGVLALLLFLGVPNYLNQHRIRQRNVCRAQLQAMAEAEARWANETQARRGDVPSADALLRYLRHGRLPVCPSGGTYTVNPAGTAPSCSFALTLGHQL